MAMSGHVFHNRPIPQDYAKVVVVLQVDQNFHDYNLDIATPEGITQLGQALKQFILWHRRDIVIVGGPLSPSHRQLQFFQIPTSSPKDQGLVLQSPPTTGQASQAVQSAPTSQQEAQEQALQSPLSNPKGQEAPQSLPSQEAPQSMPSPPKGQEAPQAPRSPNKSQEDPVVVSSPKVLLDRTSMPSPKDHGIHNHHRHLLR